MTARNGADMGQGWTPERRRAQAARIAAIQRAITPEQRAEMNRKRLATRAAKKAGLPVPARASREASLPPRAAVEPVQPHATLRDVLHPAPASEPPVLSMAPAATMPTCPLLGALLGQVVTTIARQSVAPVASAGVPDRLEAEVLRWAVELADASGEDAVEWFAAYTAFFRVARALAEQRRRRVA